MRGFRPRRSSCVGALAVAAVMAAAGCGAAGSDEDPAAVLERAFGAGASVNSGSFDISLELEGNAELGRVEASIDGRFDSSAGTAVPLLELSARISADGETGIPSFDAGLISTGSGAFVNYAGQTFEVDDVTFGQFATNLAAAEKQSDEVDDVGGVLGGLGIDPLDWITAPRNLGTERVAGSDAIHISATPDIGRLLSDLGSLAERTGQSDRLPRARIEALTELLSEPSVDVWSGAQDGILRRFELAFELAGAELEPVPIKLSIELGDINQPQVVEAPADSLPLGQLSAWVEGTR